MRRCHGAVGSVDLHPWPGLYWAGVMAITTEADPTPMVLGIAAALRRSKSHKPSLIAGMKGVAAVCSEHDPQAVTIRFSRGDVHVEHGRADDVGVAITMDLAKDGLPGAPKPNVEGALTHLRFALSLAKVIDPPLPDWRSAADSYWAACSTRPHMPSGIIVVETDSGDRHVVGDPTTAGYEVHGPADRLARVFVGTAVALEELLKGRIQGRGPLGLAVAITDAGLALGLGEVEP